MSLDEFVEEVTKDKILKGSSMNYIGIDNGVTGTIGIIREDRTYEMYKTPIIKQQNYTKAKDIISRVDVKAFEKAITTDPFQCLLVILERPMINSKMFKSSLSAIRCLESMLTVLETLSIPYRFIDSKEWQKEMLPKGTEGKELKTMSAMIGTRLFPECKDLIAKHKDADGILIAEYARRKGW